MSVRCPAVDLSRHSLEVLTRIETSSRGSLPPIQLCIGIKVFSDDINPPQRSILAKHHCTSVRSYTPAMASACHSQKEPARVRHILQKHPAPELVPHIHRDACAMLLENSSSSQGHITRHKKPAQLSSVAGEVGRGGEWHADKAPGCMSCLNLELCVPFGRPKGPAESI